MRIAVLALLLSTAACSESPWRQASRAESRFREAAERAAWIPGFLTSPGRFAQLSPESKSHFSPSPFHFSSLQLSSGLRFYVVGDPTENIDPPLKHCVVMVRRGTELQVEANVVTPETYFQGLFKHLDGYDPDRDEFYEMCVMSLKLFGSDFPQPSCTRVLFSVQDIPADPGEPVPQEFARKIHPPVLKRELKGGGGGKEWWIRFEGVFHTWEFYSGRLAESRFEIDWCLAGEKSRARVTHRMLAESVGNAAGLK